MDLDYKKKLEAFNATPKYKYELRMLASMVNPRSGETIMDYGCGIGTAIDFMRKEYPKARIKGFDPSYYQESELVAEPDKVYFMHSFSHIKNVDVVVSNYVSFGVKRFVVLTPNPDWIKETTNPDYMPDSTIIKHWTQPELKTLFESMNFNTTIYHMGQPSTIGTQNRERLLLIADRK